jgi:hypothetical protein
LGEALVVEEVSDTTDTGSATENRETREAVPLTGLLVGLALSLFAEAVCLALAKLVL